MKAVTPGNALYAAIAFLIGALPSFLLTSGLRWVLLAGFLVATALAVGLWAREKRERRTA